MSNKDIEEISINLTKEQAEDLKKAFGLDELKEIHNRFENGTETIEDIKNHCLNYVIKNENGLELRVVEVKYFEKLIEHIDQLENILADREAKIEDIQRLQELLDKSDANNIELQKEIENLKNDTYWKGYIDKQNEAVEICKIYKYKAKANKYDRLVNKIEEKNKEIDYRLNETMITQNDMYYNIGKKEVIQDLLETIEGE